MEVVIKPFYALPCACKVFTINGKRADISDFGHMRDTNFSKAEPYGCGCMRFIADSHKIDEAVKTYNITTDEFNEICNILEAKLFVGKCNWCV